MDEREREICSRVKQLREDIGLSQSAFARELGLTLDQLASVEYARIPLRFALGNWICGRFDVCQRWLAEGKLPVYYFYFETPRVLIYIPPQMLFSQAYDKFLKSHIDPHLKELAAKLGCSIEKIKPEDAHYEWAGAMSGKPLDAFLFVLNRTVKSQVAQLPSEFYGGYYREMRGAHLRFLSDNKAAFESLAQKKLPPGHKDKWPPKIVIG